MKDFLKFLLATIVGILITSVMFFFVLLIIISASSQNKPVEAKPNSILHITLSEQIVERSTDSPFNLFPSDGFSSMKQLGLNDILNNIKKAKSDNNIVGIYIEPYYLSAGIGTIEEIRNALIDFKESGKFIISYSEIYTQSAYYLVSVSDKIYLNPTGELPLYGMGASIVFLKDAMDRLGIEAQIIRHGTYKSAVEPLMYNKMSDENREQTLTWVKSIWNHLLQGISNERNIPVATLNNLADNLTLKSAEDALKYNLVDSLLYKDEVINKLKELTGTAEKNDLNSISLNKYTKVPKTKDYKGLARDKIAVIYAHGDVVMGNRGEGTISSERISKAIRKARRDSTIKAIVLRVNSGGGSALASEVIWREVDLAKDVKPVVASMGDVAASGGYYIVAPADTIVANPNTITGSIGVFSVLPNAQKFFNNKLGINMDVAKTNPYADIGNPFRPLEDEETALIRFGIEKIYDTFVSHVSSGRDMTWQEVDAIGQGRVWSGANALENGLVDVYGGLNQAIEIAAGMCGIEKYRVVELPELEDPLQLLIKELSENARMRILKKELGEHYRYLEQLEKLKDMTGPQARLPFEVELH
jgi:protease IV